MAEIEITQIEKQFWVLQNVYRNNTAYNIPVVIRIKGIPESGAMEYAINTILKRHEILRTFILEENGKIIQKTIDAGSAILNIESTVLPEVFSEPDLHEAIREEVHRVFRLDKWPLFGIRLFIFANGVSVLTIVFHHIIIDLRSKEVFAHEFSELYNSFCEKNPPVLNDPPLSYADYSGWEISWLRNEEAQKTANEWKKYIPLAPDNLEIPADYPKPKINDLTGKRKYFTLDKDLSFRIIKFARENSVNPFTVLLTSYAIFLHRLTGQGSFIIGVPLTNRRKDEYKDTIGCFVNIVPLLIRCENDIDGTSLLNQIRQSLLVAHRIQELPFLKINELLKNNGAGSVLQTGFTFEYPVNLSLNGLDSRPLVVEKHGSQLDLFVTMWEEEGKFRGYMEYSSLLFNENTIKRYTGILLKITRSLPEAPGLAISDLDIVSDEEAQRILSWNETDHQYTDNICLHQRFEDQVRKTPRGTALLYDDQELTYSEFDRHINRLANHLVGSGVKTEDIVCVCMERTPQLMVAIYAILKAGGAYLPVDPGYPRERLDAILSDAGPKFILTNKKSEKNIPDGFNLIHLDDIFESPLSDNDKAPAVDVRSHNLAYLIYTSGSTGKPKGVMIEHHSVINKLEWMQYKHPLDSNDVILLKTPVTFDVSVWEIFWWMFNGARVAILPPGGEKEPGTIIREVETKKVSAIVFVPSMFSPFVSYIRATRSADKLKTLKWIIQIGEALTPQLVTSFNELRTSAFNPLMVNTYGPTEATVAVSWYNCPNEGKIDKIYIGSPVFNTKLLVMNPRNKIQPAGVPGELVITGVNLSRGYLNRPELNKEKFIEFRFIDERIIRGYKTGDLVKWTVDGNIDFIGRRDAQVKIRGYRIELGDIESKLLSFPEVKFAAVVVNQSNPENKIIIGYAVLKTPGSASPEEILRFLASSLPEYMIPARLMILSEMPLNNSGKIDRKALPVPDLISGHQFVAPVSTYERGLQQIWKETLIIDKVGITHNFFDIGGNSIMAIRIVSEIREKLGIDLEPIHIMEFPTIRTLAKFISEQEGGAGFESTVKPEEKNIRIRDFSRLKERRH